MPLPADHPADRRDQRLARIRRVSLWVAGGTAAATLGLGTAFAHALPGHHAPSAAAGPGAAGPRPQASRAPQPAASGAAPSSPAAQPSASPAPSPAATHLSPPAQAPAPAPAPAQTTSGGS
ncbi:MAG TPA: hypothetical protein VMI33_02675 [Streptosporangiaceae bacterium]|nr:hypothetical protein [Streptosporangiaceae bacterium]